MPHATPPGRTLSFATWNVNSIRARVDRVAAWLSRTDVDVVAIQETKATDAKFPHQVFADLGYEVAHHGISQWNGVAILSRVGIENIEIGFPGMPTYGEPAVSEARAIGATCGGLRIWSLYVPNGRTVGDPHFHYKLDWYEALRVQAREWLTADPDARIALCGDFNVAPTDEDVWDMAAFVGSTHVTDEERSAYRGLVAAGYADVVRPHTPGPGVFTYWDYQQLRFARRQGMRIDFALCSPALAAMVELALIDRDERKGTGASDHAPVIVRTSAPVPGATFDLASDNEPRREHS